MTLPRLIAQALRPPLTRRPAAPERTEVMALAARLAATGRRAPPEALAVRHIDGGGCGGCAMELAAAQGLAHGLAALGIRFVEDPAAADVLLLTGPVTRNMAPAVARAIERLPPGALVLAVGDCALDGGVFKGSYAVLGGLEALARPDLRLPGCPPAPSRVVDAFATLIAALAQAGAGAGQERG
ncbi:MAG: hydrogenase [Rhodovarius sp.]|nr:hydrogenase [Rhodovarius sp.]